MAVTIKGAKKPTNSGVPATSSGFNPDGGNPLIQTTPITNKGKVTFVNKVIKNDTYMVLAAGQTFPEDEFVGLYYTTEQNSKRFIEPPYNLKFLKQVTRNNNTLRQCIDAMVTNVSSTGFDLGDDEDDTATPDDKEVSRIKDFFKEPYPRQSHIEIMKEVEDDYESIGFGALEILRFMDNSIAGYRRVDAATLRFVKLDAPVWTVQTVIRNGKEFQMGMWMRERRLAQKFGLQYRFYREYGSSRNVDRDTGDWETEENKIPPERRATELLIFSQLTDVDTPYGLPRWINNVPAILGSRKAEEHNLEFFDAGGMPPALIFIEGGMLAKEMADTLKMYLSGQAKSRHRAAVIEAQSASGSLDKPGNVSVKVERFGHEAIKDGMFQTYDQRCEDHTRQSFRLPGIFLGISDAANFAAAQVDYMVAEGQVFKPERDKRDNVINLTIMRELKAKGIIYKSKGITMKAAQDQISALTIAKDQAKGQSLVKEVNRVTGLNLEHDPAKDKATLGAMQQKAKPPPGPNTRPSRKPGSKQGSRMRTSRSPGASKKVTPGAPGKKGPVKNNRVGVRKFFALAEEFLASEDIIEAERVYSEEEKVQVRKQIDDLPDDERDTFDYVVSALVDGVEIEDDDFVDGEVVAEPLQLIAGDETHTA